MQRLLQRTSHSRDEQLRPDVLTDSGVSLFQSNRLDPSRILIQSFDAKPEELVLVNRGSDGVEPTQLHDERAGRGFRPPATAPLPSRRS